MCSFITITQVQHYSLAAFPWILHYCLGSSLVCHPLICPVVFQSSGAKGGDDKGSMRLALHLPFPGRFPSDYLTCSTVSSLWAFCPGVQAGLLWSCAPHSGPAGVVLQVLGKRPSLHTPVSSVASYFLSPPAVTLHRVGSTASFVTGALPFLMLLLIRFYSTCGLKNVR